MHYTKSLKVDRAHLVEILSGNQVLQKNGGKKLSPLLLQMMEQSENKLRSILIDKLSEFLMKNKSCRIFFFTRVQDFSPEKKAWELLW